MKLLTLLAGMILAVSLAPAIAHAASPPVTVLTWTPPTQNTDGTAISVPLTYNIYEYAAGLWTKVGSTAAGVITFSIQLGFGSTTNFRVTAVEGTAESAPSNVFTKIIAAAPSSTPNPPTNGKAQ